MSIVLLVLGIIAALIVYCQIGWMLTSFWERTCPHWDPIGSGPATFIWPLVAFFLYILVPIFYVFVRLVTAPQRLIEQRRDRRKVQEEERQRLERDARRKQQLEEDQRQHEAATSPAAEIARINDKLVGLADEAAKLAARKAELERRPDATRH